MPATKRKRPFGGEPRYAAPGVYGTAADWAAAAEAMAAGFELPPHMNAADAYERRIGFDFHGGDPFPGPSKGGKSVADAVRFKRLHPDLALLGLEAVPADAKGFKDAFRAAAMAAHPDRGGSTERMQAVNAAWDRIKRRYGA